MASPSPCQEEKKSLVDEKPATDAYPSPDGSQDAAFDFGHPQQQQQQQHQPYNPTPYAAYPQPQQTAQYGQQPFQISNNRAPVPIPCQHSQARQQPAQLPPANGPMSSAVKVPARPKPGRKPIQHANEEDKSDKRRAQNRDSQRRFRDKRQLKLNDTTMELGSMEERAKKMECDYRREIDRLNTQARQEAKVRESLEAEIRQLRAQLANATNCQSNFNAVSFSVDARSRVNLAANPTPSDDYAAQEFDFTQFGKNPRRPASSREDSLLECGFCQGDTAACLCISENLGRDPQQSSAPTATRGPGSCAACQNDATGETRRKCMELAQNTTYDTTMTDARDAARDSFAVPTNQQAPKGSETMSCIEFLNEHQQRAVGSFRPLNDAFNGRIIQGYQNDDGPIDLDRAEAAVVLSSMSRRNTATDFTRNGGLM